VWWPAASGLPFWPPVAEQPLHVPCHHVYLQVYQRTWNVGTGDRVLKRVRDQGHAEGSPGVVYRKHREADTVHRDRAFLCHVVGELRGQADLCLPAEVQVRD